MKSFMKKSFAVILTLVMLSSSFMCLAAVELNADAVAAHKGQFEKYVLLGDSVASGYRDEMSDKDAANNDLYADSTYCRYEGSYADVLADAILENQDNMTALAAPGFRTIEMRYMLEDDFAATCEDEYLFHPSHLYVYEDELCPECGEYKLPGSEHFRKMFKESIAEADLITLGIGGNDWGAYLGWVIADILEKDNYAKQYANKAKEIIDDGTMDMATVEKLVEVAGLAGAIPELMQTLPATLDYGLGNFYKNWNVMIEDIYKLNPDVTLMVVGMSDNSIKGKNYDYDVAGEAVEVAEQPEAIKGVIDFVIDFIMGVGNGPMIEGAKKFGYTYVDIDGATYVDSHPDADGHVFIANKIIEALPDRAIANKFDDVKPGYKYYNDIEYVIKNGIMSATSETTFSPDEALTTGQLAAAFNAINGTDDATDGTKKVSAVKLAFTFLTQGAKGGIAGFFKGISLYFQVIINSGFKVGAAVTRAEAANYFKTFCA